MKQDIKQCGGLAIQQFFLAHALQDTQLELRAVMDFLLAFDARDAQRLISRNPLAKG